MSIDLISVGFLVTVIGVILIVIGSFFGGGKTKVAVGGFIGPIPFGFASDTEMMKYVLVVLVIIAIIFIIFVLKGVIL